MMKKDKKQQIVDVAGELMSRKGYKSTTLDEIAHLVQLDKSTLFHYFNGKKEILDLVVGKSLKEAIKRIKAICDNTELEPDEKLRVAIKAHCESLVKNFHSIKVFFDEFTSLSKSKQVRFTSERKAYERLFEELVKDVQKKNMFHGLDSKITTFGILGMCNWLIFWYKENSNHLSPGEIAETFYRSLRFK